VATLQMEVGRRLIAGPGDDDFGVLSLLVQLPFEPLRSFKIPAACFFPEPEVDSACVSLVRRPKPLLSPEMNPIYTQIVKRSFSQRRKMMFKLLKQDWPLKTLEQAFETLALPVQSRAETLSVQQFVQLTRLLHAGGSGSTPCSDRTPAP
jgi:16S rRNA (adenine1518-N6/adenine1519-N6)-dimethyltransferase